MSLGIFSLNKPKSARTIGLGEGSKKQNTDIKKKKKIFIVEQVGNPSATVSNQ